MWNSIVRPQHFTVDSLKAIQQSKLSRSTKQHEYLKRNIIFPSGKLLPKHIRMFFPPLMINVPLEDFDPFYAGMEVSL